jgi:hypothetical protein
MIILLYMCVSSIHNHTTYMFIIKHITCSDFLALPQCGISQAFAELCTRPTLDSPGELRLWVLLFFYGFPMVRWWFFVGVQWFSIVSLHVFPREMLSFLSVCSTSSPQPGLRHDLGGWWRWQWTELPKMSICPSSQWLGDAPPAEWW